MIFKYLTSIVKTCVFKLFSLRKITKSNHYHHLPTLNIANLFMQSFASPFLHPHPTHQIYAPPTQKGRNYRLYPRPFYPKNHRKGATIAYTYALSTKKSIERAQLSLVLAKNITIFAKNKLTITIMTSNGLIGRAYEQKLINSYINSEKAELIAVYGRRRVGKTFLIKRMFDENFAFSFTGIYDVSRAVLLSQFKKHLERYSESTIPKIKNWFEAFDALQSYLETLKSDKIVLFFDELPWMDTPKSNFLAAFGQFWNTWASTRPNVKIIVCGSATTWMLSKFIGDKGGLYGRVCRSIWLKPFTLGETEAFIKEIKGIELTRSQILETYMIFGGIPYYLDMLIKGIPLSKNVDELLFKQGAPLRMEFNFLFRSLFNEAEIYRKVIETLASKMKGMSRQEIADALKLKKGGFLTEVLENLITCDFIRKYNAIGKTGQDAQYQLTDLFSFFHIKFVAHDSGQDSEYWSKITGKGKMTAWSGYAFEQVCLHHIDQIKQALSIGGVIGNICSWACKPFIDKNGTQWKGGQIDLLIDRADDVINICEIKHVSSKYVIDADYEQRLRDRASLFRTVTKTKKALHHTFITTYGVAQNSHSGIVQSEVKMDDLFN